jgi:hypothetical protein
MGAVRQGNREVRRRRRNGEAGAVLLHPDGRQHCKRCGPDDDSRRGRQGRPYASVAALEQALGKAVDKAVDKAANGKEAKRIARYLVVP